MPSRGELAGQLLGLVLGAGEQDAATGTRGQLAHQLVLSVALAASKT